MFLFSTVSLDWIRFIGIWINKLMYEFWSSLAPETRAVILNAIPIVFSGTIGALVVVWQIGRQARNALNQNSHNEALKLKLEIYKEILGACREAGDAGSEMLSFLRVLNLAVERNLSDLANGRPTTAPAARYKVMSQNFITLSDGIVGLISIIERWQIIEPRMLIFQTAANVVHHDILNAQNDFLRDCMTMLPVDLPNGNGSIVHWSSLSADNFGLLLERSTQLQSSVQRLYDLIYDFQVEMQNCLLGGIFQNKVGHRIPIDPNNVVVTLENHSQIAAYLENDTPWGRNKIEVEKNVRKQFDLK
jgi:hypothetical protein